MSNIDKYTKFITEQTRKEITVGLRSVVINEDDDSLNESFLNEAFFGKLDLPTYLKMQIPSGNHPDAKADHLTKRKKAIDRLQHVLHLTTRKHNIQDHGYDKNGKNKLTFHNADNGKKVATHHIDWENSIARTPPGQTPPAPGQTHKEND
jgi:hypothetical protein